MISTQSIPDQRQLFELKLRQRALILGERTLVMGILNVTPDSFSDGGLYNAARSAIARAVEMEAEGADIIDIGGESTRPGAPAVSAEEELRRVMPVLEGIKGKLKIPISIDTYKAVVADETLKAGAEIVNDVSGLKFDPALAGVVARHRAALVLMHTRGRPEVMQKLPPSPDILAEIEQSLKESVNLALRSGVAEESIIIDPGIGFGKTVEDNLAIIKHLDRFASFNLPIMIGTSRKTFIGRILGKETGERLMGTAATVAASILRGAHIVRVHDVREMAEVARMTDAIIKAKGNLLAG